MALFKYAEEMIAVQEDVGTLSASLCGCYMTNASCGGSTDFGSSGGAAQACAQSVFSAQSPTYATNCPSN